eukprot:TRINITY_DN1374_c0_g3_i1.p1 TRINITY_DN1374_c0_g3~~TRINITY_DN1374_c0_g3_i1.p1  ORF type:complete len:421 (+),score=136.81 TRINITY_DN1374_c0_g3_i1:70-1332(+)
MSTAKAVEKDHQPDVDMKSEPGFGGSDLSGFGDGAADEQMTPARDSSDEFEEEEEEEEPSSYSSDDEESGAGSAAVKTPKATPPAAALAAPADTAAADGAADENKGTDSAETIEELKEKACQAMARYLVAYYGSGFEAAARMSAPFFGGGGAPGVLAAAAPVSQLPLPPTTPAPGTHARAVDEPPSEMNDWGGVRGRAPQPGDKDKPSDRPWEHRTTPNGALVAFNEVNDPLPKCATAGGAKGTGEDYHTAGGMKSCFVARCDCKAKGLTGDAVVEHHRQLSAWRWVAAGGKRVWSAAPPCLCAALGVESFDDFKARMVKPTGRITEAYRSAAAARTEVYKNYHFIPNMGKDDGEASLKALGNVWQALGAPMAAKRGRDGDEGAAPVAKRAKPSGTKKKGADGGKKTHTKAPVKPAAKKD